MKFPNRAMYVQSIFAQVESRGGDVFQWEEHRRLSTVIASVLERNEHLVLGFLKENYTPDTIYGLDAQQNLWNMFRCLYFECSLFDEEKPDTVDWLKAILTVC